MQQAMVIPTASKLQSTTEKGGAEEAKKKGLKHTFASYARPSASHPFVVLSNWVVRYKPARSICNVVSC
jgi:hypothetical protein